MTPNRAPVAAKKKVAAAAPPADGDGATPIGLEDVLAALTAMRDGDFTVRLPQFTDGTLAAIAERFNEVAEINAGLADEFQRAARVIGREGRMTERVALPERGGEWQASADAVNALIDDLVRPATEYARVIAAVAEGDLNQKAALEIEGQPVKGEFLRIGTTVNSMVEQLRSFADEVTRVAREVGTEGKLGGQADVHGVSGTWKDLTDSVNFMAGNLTGQVRNIAQVTTAVANGDLSQKITVDVKGEMLELKDTINTMVDQLSSFADEVTRVAREVGTEGKLGGQAEVEGVSGTWRDLTENVNQLAGNLTGQVRNIAQVTTAVANGDLSQKITVDARGEILELKDTINTMVDQLSSFADEVTRVAREVGTEGRLGGQAEVEGVSGTWRDLTDSVNFMAGNLTGQVRNIAQVTTAVARGDLTQKITVDVKGEMLELKDTINTMVDQLSSFADEVTRVAREVGTEGKLGGQARVEGVSGTWKDLTDNVNFMAGNLTGQVRNIAQVTTAVANGDLSQKITVDVKGEMLELKATINTMVDQLSSFADEVTRVAREVGTEGRLGGQAEVPGVSGTWKRLTENVNQLAGNLTGQVRNIAQVTTAVARGDLSQKITVDARGEILELKNTINTMVDQLSSFADEVTRVAREVGTEGRLGGQAAVQGVSGTWRDLTDSVNFMAGNLTGQVRNIAQVTTAVARGDLTQKITVDVKGEMLELKQTINTMVDQLSSFADEVTRVAKEVGTEGKLGGQADVPGVAGTWKALTHNVNQLAKTLTIQLRAIAEVSTAVTQGDLTRSITVQAEGEVAELKDNINQMIANLRETTQRNAEQDWLKTNLAKISSMLQGQRDLGTVSRLIMSEVTPVASAQLGAFFMLDPGDDDPMLRLIASYGYTFAEGATGTFKLGEGLVGQAAMEGKPILISDAQAAHLQVTSGLVSAAPINVVVLPVLFEEQVLAVIELASLRPFTDTERTFLDQTMETIGVVLNTILANMRTEELLEQSQRLTQELQNQSRELQSQQDELRKTNAELQEKAALLSEQNRDIELKNREIELARRGVEEKAEQLALSSRYKSEFLANMSHELRTPLNSLLILTKLLADNIDENLTPQQIEFANTIYAAGSDLLELINDILDLSKVEAGKMDIAPTSVEPAEIREYVDRTFRPVAEENGLDFTIEVTDDVPATITTDGQRLQQVLRNLLSNAFKFTESGGVTMCIGTADADEEFSNPALVDAEQVLRFAVTDTGIGVAADKLQLIFEEFQQEDGTTSRRYGGTGLGLSISRAIARLLGGEIHVESEVGKGSTFTLFIPAHHDSPVPVLDPAEETQDVPFIAGELAPASTVRSMPIRRPQPLPAERPRVTDETLAGRKILVVDDDVRNVFALTSALESYGMEVLFAENGKKGIDVLLRNTDVDLVLMDIMMPEMDGYETCRAIRSMPQFQRLPIISLTAKAMTGDREKSIASGASDYITKPVEIDQLMSLMRMWLTG